jgi:hypothetical protein
MTEQTWLERNGATPGKLAVIGTLAVMLIAVIWHNVAASQSPAESQTSRPSTPQPIVAAATPMSTKPIPAATDVVTTPHKVWPKYSLEKVTKYDPLAKPMWFLMAQAAEEGTAGASLARSAQVLEELKKQPTKIVVISGNERIATIGELSFRVGDTIEGFQVTEITTDGIVLTELGR